MYRPRASGAFVVWIVIGVIIAANHHFFDSLASFSKFLSAVTAVLLWPLVLFNVHLTIAI